MSFDSGAAIPPRPRPCTAQHAGSRAVSSAPVAIIKSGRLKEVAMPAEPRQRQIVTAVGQKHFRIGRTGRERQPMPMRAVLIWPNLLVDGFDREFAQSRRRITPVTVQAYTGEEILQFFRR